MFDRACVGLFQSTLLLFSFVLFTSCTGEYSTFADRAPCLKTQAGDLCYRNKNGFALVDGDIVIGDVDEIQSWTKREARGAMLDSFHIYRTWPNGVMPYTIADDFPNNLRGTLEVKMAEIHNSTGFRLVPRTFEKDYVTFVRADEGCRAHMGRQGGEQFIWLAPNCGSAILHEIGHAMGFWHEHQRPDRDQYIEIHWNNILAGWHQWFETRPFSAFSAYLADYDYDSVMHYPSNGSSNGGGYTLTRRDNGQPILLAPRLSQKDIQSIEALVSTHRFFPGHLTSTDDKEDLISVHSNGSVWLNGSHLSQDKYVLRQSYLNPQLASTFRADSTARFFAGDFNGDRIQDVVFAAPDGNIWGMTNLTRRSSTQAVLLYQNLDWGQVFHRDSPARFFVGDIDGDKKDELVFAWPDGNIWGLFYQEDRMEPRLLFQHPTWGEVHHADSRARFFMMDVNGDARSDLVFTWDDGHIWGLFSDGNALHATLLFAHPPWGAVFSKHSEARFFAMDYNGDNKDDLVFTWPDGHVWGLASNGATLTHALILDAPGWGDVFKQTSSARFFSAELNGDGKKDLLFTWPDGNVWGLLSAGSHLNIQLLAQKPEWAGVFVPTSPAQFHVLDVNGDGKHDLGFAWPDGNLWVGLSQGASMEFKLFGKVAGAQ